MSLKDFEKSCCDWTTDTEGKNPGAGFVLCEYPVNDALPNKYMQ